jgi:hypothetical protein
MLTISSVATALATALSDRLQAGALADIGAVSLMSGLSANAELATRVLLADADHLGALAEHTGEPAGDDRWALLEPSAVNDDDLATVIGDQPALL